MRRIIFLLFIAPLIIVACKDKKQNAATTDAATNVVTEPRTPELAQDPAKDSTEIRKVVTDFYNWYNKNFAKFQEYALYSSIKKKDMPPYKINWDQVTKYQDFIRASVPQLGEEFIANQKRFLQECDSAFKVNVKDELPYGFDYDWYTNSQEDPQYTVDEMNKSKQWIINVTGDNAVVNIRSYYNDNGKDIESMNLKLSIKKEAGQWKIAKIGE